MRNVFLLLIGLLASLPQQSRPTSLAAACTTATPSCTEWVALGSGPARSLIYRSRSLDTRNDNVRRALIMVHGTNRNADKRGYQLVQGLLAGKHESLRDGIV